MPSMFVLMTTQGECSIFQITPFYLLLMEIKIYSILILMSVLSTNVLLAENVKAVKNVSELIAAVENLNPGDVVRMADGNYPDVQLISRCNGNAENPVRIEAQNPGKVTFSGNTKVELRGTYTTLAGIYFKDGNRNLDEWDTHGPGLVAIYASHCRVTECLFFQFDKAQSAYITTSLDGQGNVPQYCRIDHCAFIQKTTFDQVINLNNTRKKTIEGESAPAMYHRIDHCYFSNPKKAGNAGGGIRIGYWRKDLGRCLVDNNVFERQDSEAEIVTSKSRENVYYNNLFLNCQGTLNFRHGDDQVALCNSFIGTDTKHGYGGMFIWGSGHLIANNYFNLSTTIKDRGNAAIYFNPGLKGDEHALAYNISCIRNIFDNTNGTDIHLFPLLDRRVEVYGKEKVELPFDIRFIENAFVNNNPQHLCVKMQSQKEIWENNVFSGGQSGVPSSEKGFGNASFDVKAKNGQYSISNMKRLKDKDIVSHMVISQIEGINLDFTNIVLKNQAGATITKEQTGPTWAKDNLPGEYAQTGKWELIKRKDNK